MTWTGPKPRKSSIYSARCPACGAPAGRPCLNKEGQALPGVHLQRNRARERAISAALDLYRPASRPLGRF